MTTQHQIVIIASSNPDNGAEQVSPDGSSFEINLDDAITIPKGATSCALETQEVSIWNTAPNILTGVNDKFYFEFETNPYIITVPQGLYDLRALNRTLDSLIENQLGIITEGIISLNADIPTQKVSMRLRESTLQVDFTPADTFRDIIGFNSQIVPDPNPTIGVENFLAPNVASFNTISYFLLHADLVDKGFRINHRYDQVIAQVLIDVSPGSQILSRPTNIPSIPCWGLIGSFRRKIRFWLTDQDLNRVNTNGETFSCRIVIKYDEAHENIRDMDEISLDRKIVDGLKDIKKVLLGDLR